MMETTTVIKAEITIITKGDASELSETDWRDYIALNLGADDVQIKGLKNFVNDEVDE